MVASLGAEILSAVGNTWPPGGGLVFVALNALAHAAAAVIAESENRGQVLACFMSALVTGLTEEAAL